MSKTPRETRETELGLEIRCAKCREFWPADAEFFTRGGPLGWHSWCHACQKTVKYESRHAAGTQNRFALPSVPHTAWSPLLTWSQRCGATA